MTGHSTDERGGKSDMPQSYGPNHIALIEGFRAKAVSRQDEVGRPSTYHEPKPGKELDFN